MARHFTPIACAIAIALQACGGCSKAPPTSGTLKDEGEPCMIDDDCTTGLCFALKGEALKCGRKCSLGCKPDTEVCTQVGFQKYGCVPKKEGLCKPCATSADCPYPADSCIAVGSVKVCGQDCSYDGTCAEGYRCGFAKDDQNNDVPAQCQPKSGTCDCTAASIGQRITCQKMNGVGTCLGIQTCQADGYTACNATEPAHETCNAVDDDCNNLVDDNLGDTPCGVGECRRVVANCANGLPQSCVPGMPGVETCNDKDDDCDGVVDNGFDKGSIQYCGSCTNTCAVANGAPRCAGGTCRVDTCTMPFADCNNDYVDGCETNTDSSLANCGGCNHVCAGAHATPTCTAGACVLACAMGFADLNHDVTDGCEATCTNTDDPDLLFGDTNCDGIDGNEAQSIFVDTASGNDANPGTKASPKKTINAGSSAASSLGKVAVLVSRGTYLESVVLRSGISVYGGYDAAQNWRRALADVAVVSSPSAIGARGDSINTAIEVQLMAFNASSATGFNILDDGNSSYGMLLTNSSATVTLRRVSVSAGNGYVGNDGANGAAGPGGGRGGDASGVNRGGQGGSACGAPGGFGGQGVSGTNAGNPGTAGTQALNGGAGGLPGQGGPGGDCSTFSSGDPGPAPNVTSVPGTGGQGASGALPAALGTLNATIYFVPNPGGSGLSGWAGGGGGGGGSGGGTAHGSGFPCLNCSGVASGGGGGGGGGGCGGQGGIGGRGGGGSFAIAALQARVVLDQCSLTSAAGGRGGNGGAGGNGGLGGDPGNYAAGETQTSCTDRTGGHGAAGAAGAPGGRGGGGSGGPGGPSACVLYKGLAPTLTTTDCTNGSPSQGGNGGPGGSAGPTGPQGITGVSVAAN